MMEKICYLCSVKSLTSELSGRVIGPPKRRRMVLQGFYAEVQANAWSLDFSI